MNRNVLARTLDVKAIDAQLSRRNLSDYIQNAWDAIVPRPLVWSWSMGAIAEHLQAVTEGQIKHLIITIHPRSSKSLITSVFWPSWTWLDHSSTQFLYSSYGEQLANRDSGKTRALIQSKWYQSIWSDRYELESTGITYLENSKGGYRLATSVGGRGTGEGGDIIVCDDPNKVEEAFSKVKRDSVIAWWDTVMTTRLNDQKTGHYVIIQQRVHENDLTGHVLAKELEGWTHLYLPSEYIPSKKCITPIWEDPRTKAGEVLNKKRFPKKILEALKSELGDWAYEGQMQGNPSPLEGGMIKRGWWKFYEQGPADIAAECDFLFQSWDMSFKETPDSHFVVGGVWGVKGANCYRIDEMRDRMDFVDTKKAVISLSQKWPDAYAKLVEDKANGPAIISQLRDTIGGFIPVDPGSRSKPERLSAVSPMIQAGNVWLPKPTGPEGQGHWVEPYINELCVFPAGEWDDRVDETSQALEQARKKMKAGLFGPPGGPTRTSYFLVGAGRS